MATATYTKAGTKATTAAKLDANVFGLEVTSHELLKQAYVTYMANGRENLAKTKKRGEVNGSTIKPWKQKGTGRARFGSKYNPIWRGGGVVFGPSGNENYSKALNTKAKRLAAKQALSMTASEGRIKVIEAFDNQEGKVAVTAAFFKKIEATGKVLLVVNTKDNLVERATRNLTGVKAVSADYVNVYDVMNADLIIIEQAALKSITARLATDEKAVTASTTIVKGDK
jgi:large subunit ribosomal protein L4